jgi:hypothetical protein
MSEDKIKTNHAHKIGMYFKSWSRNWENRDTVTKNISDFQQVIDEERDLIKRVNDLHRVESVLEDLQKVDLSSVSKVDSGLDLNPRVTLQSCFGVSDACPEGLTLSESEFISVTQYCGLSKYLNSSFYRKGLVTYSKFIALWNEICHLDDLQKAFMVISLNGVDITPFDLSVTATGILASCRRCCKPSQFAVFGKPSCFPEKIC